MATKRFYRKTAGLNAQVFTCPALAYSTQNSIALFEANAAKGEVAVFDASNNTLITGALTSGQEFFIMQKTTQGVKRSPTYKFSDIVATKKVYVAPVKQVSCIGFNRTGGDVNAVAIAAGQTFGVKVVECTDGNDPFPTWNYEYTSKYGDALIDVMRAIAKRVNDSKAVEHKQNQRLVTAKVIADATYSAFTLGGTSPTATFTNGSDTVTLGGTSPVFNGAVGDYLSVDASATPSDTVGDIYKIIAVSAGVSVTLDRPYTGTTIVMTQAQAQGTRLNKAATFVAVGLEFTTIDNDVFFRLAVNGNLENADITYVTAYTRGNGEDVQVKALELEGQTFYGDTTKNAAFAADYGQQDYFWVAAETYDYIQFSYLKSIPGHAPAASDAHRGNVIMALAKSSGGLTASLATIFGV